MEFTHIAPETTNSLANTPLIAAQAPLDSAKVIHCAFRLKSEIAISSSFFVFFTSTLGVVGALSSAPGDGGNENSGSAGRLRERRACRAWGVVVEELEVEDAAAMRMGFGVGGSGWGVFRAVWY